MQGVTLALALLIGAGFMMAKLGQFFRLPSVTGYICAGLLLGPSGLNLVKVADLGPKLEHFTQIALMLIAFGIGEHLEMKRLRHIMKSVGLIGLFETSGAFLLVALGTFMVARMTNIGEAGWVMKDYLVLAILLGAVSVATAPAATLHVMRELKATGPFTSTLMAVVAVDDGLAIIFFSMAVTAAHHIVGGGTETILSAVAGSFAEITCSLLMGVMAGLLIDFVVNKLKDRGEMLTAGLMILLLCGEGTRLLNFSPLLAGMAAGFTIVNQDRRDVRVFRTINAFEPPIYVLFFTLAGAHLHISALATAGWIGLVYFLLRSLGKFFGANIGALLAEAPSHVRRYLGLALVPQAGVAIGLIFLIEGDAGINEYSSVIIPAVLAAVVLSELSGPVCARVAVEKTGEAACEGVTRACR
jgi:Kef-type K+ transport system membrane component KefB